MKLPMLYATQTPAHTAVRYLADEAMPQACQCLDAKIGAGIDCRWYCWVGQQFVNSGAPCSGCTNRFVDE